MTPDPHTLREVTLFAALLTAILAVTLAAGLGPAARTGDDPVLVIAPPWDGGVGALVQAAGGRIVGPVSAPFGALASFPAPGADPSRLRRLGAWAVRDAAAFAALCGPPSTGDPE